MTQQTSSTSKSTPQTRPIPSATTGSKPLAFVDGSNLLLGLLDQGLPSVLIFANVVSALKKHDFDVITIFDQSIRYHLEKRGCKAEWQKLENLADASNGEILFQVQADPHLLAMASASGNMNSVIVNFTDRYKEFAQQFPNGLPELVRVSYAVNLLSFAFGGSNRLFSEHIDRNLALFGVSLSVGCSGTANPQQDKRPQTILQSKNKTSRTLRARLVVFLLDGSGSMMNRDDGAMNTFDGQRKSEHLSKIFLGVVERLAEAKSAASFYAGLISFAGRPSVVEISGARMSHVSHLLNHIKAPAFSYCTHAKGNGTDLCAALDAAVQLIDEVLNAEDAKYIATDWSATIILITDALVNQEERIRQSVARLGMARNRLTNGQISIGCVGIGSDQNDRLLVDIASSPSPATKHMLQRRGLDSRLLTRKSGDPCLAIKVSQVDPEYPDVVRRFMDLMTETC